ncbi:MAG: DUF1616 domain-containing protein [Candidatus Bathyarchaeota archaeon]|nr:DUF1616 domain-containing protein [Candidatus Bathyarchaeota archaeon]
MTQGLNQTRGQIKQLILDTIEKQAPETTDQLIAAVKDKTDALDTESILNLIVELENEGNLIFTDRSSTSNFRSYIFSKKASWFWVVIILSIGSCLSTFIISDSASPIRLVFSSIFVLFLPGYAIIRLLFPIKVPITTQSQNMDDIERIAMSFGTSIVLVPMVGLILNYTPWGIRLIPLTTCLLLLTVFFAILAVWRSSKQFVLHEQH